MNACRTGRASPLLELLSNHSDSKLHLRVAYDMRLHVMHVPVIWMAAIGFLKSVQSKAKREESILRFHLDSMFKTSVMVE